MSLNVKDYIRTIADFPHEGILFRDVTTLFADARGFRIAVDQLLAPYAGARIDKVVGLEARGFILGGAVEAGRAGADRGRPAGHRRHGGGGDQPVRKNGGQGGGLRLCDRPAGPGRAKGSGRDGA